MLNGLRRRAERRQIADRLFERLVEQSRSAVFHEGFGVPDTIDGRFDLLVLHVWLVLDRLAAGGDDAVSQALVDRLFLQLDEALREQGAGDIGMARRLGRMADAFYGRLKAYGAAPSEDVLAEAIARNVYRGALQRLEPARALAIYVFSAKAALKEADLTSGMADFGPIPSLP